MIISQEIPNFTQKVSLEIAEKSEKLNSFPEAGRIVPEIDNVNIREILIYSYRLIYEVFPDKVEVLALIHSKRNFIREFLNEQRHEKK